MRIDPRGRSSDLEDRRGGGGGGFGFGGGGGGFGRGRMGIGGIILVLILSVVFKQDFFSLLGGGGVQTAPAGEAPVNDPSEERDVLVLSAVLDSTQNFWQRTFPQMGQQYSRARLVLFRDATQTACGTGQAAMGPFYCPGDHRVFLDLAFLEELKSRFGAPGDFAQAYVLAHEIGHHVQNLLGISGQVHEAQQQRGGAAANQLSVRLELQADCYAGVWGHTAAQQGWLDAGDIEEGLGAAAAVGDDRLQRAATGRVSPESWTHGSSEQRVEWFKRGFDQGRPEACDTFGR